MNSFIIAMIVLPLVASEDSYSLLPTSDHNQSDFSLLDEEPVVENVPITDYIPDQFMISTVAAIVEFYNGASGPTAETDDLLQNLSNKGYKIERVRVDDNKSRLASYYKIDTLPTFMAIFDKKEVARARGIPSNEQFAQMYTIAKDHEHFKQAVLNGKTIYFSESSFLPCQEARELLRWLLSVGCDVRRADHDNSSHRSSFERYGVEQYPVFILIDENDKEVERYQGTDGLLLLKSMRDIYRTHPIKQNDQASGPKLLDFWSIGCVHCLRMDPIIDRLSTQGYDIQKINADENPNIVRKYDVRKLPTYVILNSNGVESSRAVGEVAESTLVGMLRNAR